MPPARTDRRELEGDQLRAGALLKLDDSRSLDVQASGQFDLGGAEFCPCHLKQATPSLPPLGTSRLTPRNAGDTVKFVVEGDERR